MSILNLSEYSPEPSDGMEAVHHFQKMLAFQQLAMEKVNDAFATATQAGTPTNEAVFRPSVTLYDPEAVTNFILPALKEKSQILKHMDKQQRDFNVPSEEPFLEAYISLNTAIEAMQERTSLQIEGFEAWLLGLDDIDVTSLDKYETETMDVALLNINACMQKLGVVDADGFLNILHRAFNDVRQETGLSSMSFATFRDLYVGGLEGKPARFFM